MNLQWKKFINREGIVSKGLRSGGYVEWQKITALENSVSSEACKYMKSGSTTKMRQISAHEG